MYEHFAMRFSFDFASSRLQQLYPSMWSCWRFQTGQKESRWRDVAAEGASQRHRNLKGNEGTGSSDYVFFSKLHTRDLKKKKSLNFKGGILLVCGRMNHCI